MPWFGIRAFSSFLFALGVLLTSCSGGTTHDACGLVLAVDGSLTIADQRGPANPVGPGSGFCAGAVLHTSASASAQIACFANTLVHLLGETDFELDRLTLRRDGNETADEVEGRKIHCRLPAGLIYLSHLRPWGSSELIIVTPHGTLTASSDCLIRVRVDDRRIRITSARGNCSFQPASGQSAVAVEAGFLCEWPSAEPGPVIAANEAAGQQEIAELIAAEQRLNALAVTLRSAPPPWARR